MDLIVVAKEPVPGRVKTRLCPPRTPGEAATLAAAALADTLAAATASGAARVVLALDGRPGPWCPPGVAVVGQGDGPLDHRLAAAWAAATTGPALLVGMDTPQVTAADLDRAMANLAAEGADAVLGPATDGGWWAIGLRRPDPRVFRGVPMSRSDTGDRQRARLRALRLRTHLLPTRTDVDTWPDALAVAATAPAGRFAAAVRTLGGAGAVAAAGAGAPVGTAAGAPA
ncbi:MAG TPA: TIGR04282 family arsenosugar biosynthesis glycosyltransferase [Acidimicrobiales bacterium]